MTDGERKINARHRAVDAVAEWANAYGYENPVVTSYLVIAEILTPDGRGVVWVGGNGMEPETEDEAGLMRWQIRGLIGEVDAQIRANEVSRDGDAADDDV